ncbi:hypothetical protein CKM354_000812700 [Cercospora kikuchii]|uniref:BTB domain-containing protein n=1 Tax=Cercospora kikuchii TaxID=84275 RepID=A0A9P3FEZ5_9PEZI|nr:uncharacterized protein CKM354_000812700 [Cercospora kikuchii]GIZ44943.1 hypothetical protein CKM354_000812700 [Cercospora kikuchii]
MVPMSTTERGPPDNAYVETVQVKIGPDPNAKFFTIHKGVLVFYSGYFESALRHNSTFTEARHGIFHLPEEEVGVGEIFMVFLYRGELRYPSVFFSALPTLVPLWVLADRRVVPLLMNKCIDAIKREVLQVWLSPYWLLPYVYANTAPNSALRRFILLLSVRAGITAQASSCDTMLSRYYDEESTRDLCNLLWVMKGDRAWCQDDLRKLETCPDYHSHGPDEADKCREG